MTCFVSLRYRGFHYKHPDTIANDLNHKPHRPHHYYVKALSIIAGPVYRCFKHYNIETWMVGDENTTERKHKKKKKNKSEID